MLPALCTFVFRCCSNDQISAIVGLRVKGVAKRVAEKKMRLDLRDTAIQYVDCGGWGLFIAAVADACAGSLHAACHCLLALCVLTFPACHYDGQHSLADSEGTIYRSRQATSCVTAPNMPRSRSTMISGADHSGAVSPAGAWQQLGTTLCMALVR
jgi:hypothetical protein